MSWNGAGESRAGRPFGRPGGRRPFVRPQDDPPGTSRLFIAVPAPDDVRAAVGALMEKVAGGPIIERAFGQPRWVRVDDLHVTLRFLGATPDERQADVAVALAAAAAVTDSFRIVLSGGGAFPNAHAPRVLWIGIAEGSADLGALALRLNEELVPLGWPADDRPFTPHLTLARTDGVFGADERARVLTEAAADLRLSWQADRIVLFRSLLGRGPVHYESLAESRLTPA